MHSKTSRVSERLIYLQQNDKKSTNIQLDIIWKRTVCESEQYKSGQFLKMDDPAGPFTFVGLFHFIRPLTFLPLYGSFWACCQIAFLRTQSPHPQPGQNFYFPNSELIWKNLLRNTCAHHWIFIWHHIVKEERNHV